MKRDTESTVNTAKYFMLDAEQSNDPAPLAWAVELLRTATVEPSPQLAEALSLLGTALDRQYEAGGDPELLDEIVQIDERLLALTDRTDPSRVKHATNLAFGLRRRHTLGGDVGALDRAAEVLREAVDGRAFPEISAAVVALELMVVLRTRFEATGLRDDLDAAIRAAQRGVDLSCSAADLGRLLTALAEVQLIAYRRWHEPEVLDDALETLRAAAAVPDPAVEALRTGQLAETLLLKYRRLGAPSVLGEAATVLEARLTGTTGRDEIMLSLRSLLNRTYRFQYAETDDLDALDRWVSASRAALEVDPTSVAYLSNLADALHARFLRSDDQADLTAGLECSAAALAAAEPDDPELGVLLSAHSRLQYAQYKLSNDKGTLAEAVRLARQAMARPPTGASNRFGAVDQLVTVLLARSKSLEGAEGAALLDEAVGAARATAESADRDGEVVEVGEVLARALRARYERSGDPADLDAAVDGARRAARSATGGGRERVDRWITLEQMLTIRFEHDNRADDLDEAIAACDAALAIPQIRPRDRALRQGMLASLLERRFDRTRDRADLDRALEMGEAAAVNPEQVAAVVDPLRRQSARLFTDRLRWVGERATYDAAVTAAKAGLLTAGTDGERAIALNRVGLALARRSQVTGSNDDLAEAVAAMRQSVGLAEPRMRSQLTRNLATQLVAMYDATGHSELLEESIAANRDALIGAEPDDPGIPSYLSNMGNGLRRLYQVTRHRDDLHTGNHHSRQALAMTPPDDPDRAVRLTNLASGLALESEADDDPALLDEAVDAARGSLAASTADDANHSTMLVNAGQLLRKRGRAANGTGAADLDEALDLLRRAVALLPHGDRRAPQATIELAITLSDRYDVTQEPHDLDEALETFRSVASDVLAVPDERVRAAILWGLTAQQNARVDDAVDGLTATVRLLPDLVPRHLRRHDQEHGLSRLDGLAGYAADSALAADDPGLAVTLLEQARGVLLAQAFETRGDLGALRECSPELADELEARRRLLNTLDDVSPGETTVEQRIATRRTRVEAWNAVLDEVRALPGFADFLLPPALDTLLPAAVDGPIVLLTAGDRGASALALTTSGLRVVDLAALTSDVVGELVRTFFGALRTTQFGPGDPKKAEQDILDVLDRLWTLLARPVLDALGIRDRLEDGDPARIWWVPSGLLSFLPVHAAGQHTRRDAPDAPTVLDRVVSSYAPTVRSLLEVRARAGSDRSGPGLVVSVPETPGAPALPGVREETERIRSWLPEATVLSGPAATRDAVIGALAAAGWAHFACHGVSVPARPSTSRLLVHDHREHPLTVSDISALQLAHADLAYLSACTTAQPTNALTDEAIHLTSAFQLAGYRNVVGTLWSVNDAVATRVATSVYTRLIGDGGLDTGRTALALHKAVHEARHRTPGRPSLWAAYVHAGI